MGYRFFWSSKRLRVWGSDEYGLCFLFHGENPNQKPHNITPPKKNYIHNPKNNNLKTYNPFDNP